MLPRCDPFFNHDLKRLLVAMSPHVPLQNQDLLMNGYRYLMCYKHMGNDWLVSSVICAPSDATKCEMDFS